MQYKMDLNSSFHCISLTSQTILEMAQDINIFNLRVRMYSSILWYRGFYDSVYSRTI